VQQGLRMLVNQLTEQDRVSIVVYAGSSGAVLPPTNGSNRAEILRAIDNLRAGGSTNGGEGIQLAYRFAREGFIPGGINRVILASDGDFNAGITSQQELIRLIESEAKSRVFLTVLGFGAGNLKDGLMEQLANRGNGMYAYIDSAREAKKVFVDQLQGALVTIAKDVKIQIEFNPARVERYRLIGYENRTLAARDFNDDTKDAGEIGAGHTVTALYELVPVGALAQPGVDPLKYQQQEAPKPEPVADVHSGELMTLKLRYKQPEGDASKLMEYPVMDSDQPFAAADEDFRFAASVAAFGMLLRNSPYAGTATMEAVREWAEGALGRDAQGYRTEFLDLVRKAASLR
jgi:Ca-activated chloride channel family protein